MTWSVALTEESHRRLRSHLIRQDGQEDVCFAVWSPSRGTRRSSALIREILLPQDGERRVHGNVSFLPHYFERAIERALEVRGGIALLHSHPLGQGWQRMSDDDEAAERRIAGAAIGATALPLIGLTFAVKDGTWSGRVWQRIAVRSYSPVWCGSVRVVGQRISLSLPPEANQEFAPELDRTVSAWGEDTQSQIKNLRIGVIGLGSVGSVIAESLARQGVGRLVLIDFDRAERVNRDRVLHLYDNDAEKGHLKVDISAAAIRRSATSRDFEVVAVPYSVIEPEGFRAALDCDILFSCVDRPWPRSVLNFIAYSHLIPVVDGGIRLQKGRNGGLGRGDVRAHAVGPGRTCLECLNQFTPEDVALERDGYLDDPAYIAGMPREHRLQARQNVFAFSVIASGLELMQMLSMIVTSPGLEFGPQAYHFVPGSLDDVTVACKPACPYVAMTATGENAPIAVTAAHPAAARVREGSRPSVG